MARAKRLLLPSQKGNGAFGDCGRQLLRAGWGTSVPAAVDSGKQTASDPPFGDEKRLEFFPKLAKEDHAFLVDVTTVPCVAGAAVATR